MPPAKDPKWINWRTSAAREMLLEDLEPGGYMYMRDNVTDKEAFEFYKMFPEFEKVVFSQFKVRFKAHRQAASKNNVRSLEEAQFLERDRQLHPRQTHNERGEPVFDMSEAKLMLRADVKAKRHESMTPSQLWQSRPEYQRFKLHIFRGRIYQEIRRQKFVFYLNWKRTKRRREEREKRAQQQHSNDDDDQSMASGDI